MAITTGVRFAGMFGVVEDQNIAWRSFSCDNTRILGHVSCSVNLPLVVDFYLNLDFATHWPKAPEFSLFVVIMWSIELGIFVGQLDTSNQKVILFIRGVSTKNKSVNGIILPFGFCDVRKPLCSQRWPFQSMGHHQVVQKWCILLPYFILLVDDALLNCIVESFYKIK